MRTADRQSVEKHQQKLPPDAPVESLSAYAARVVARVPRPRGHGVPAIDLQLHCAHHAQGHLHYNAAHRILRRQWCGLQRPTMLQQRVPTMTLTQQQQQPPQPQQQAAAAAAAASSSSSSSSSGCSAISLRFSNKRTHSDECKPAKNLQ